MNDYEMKVINNVTIETVTKGIINEMSKWGFKPADYITLVNALLDLSLNKPPASVPKQILTVKRDLVKLNFPLSGEQIKIKPFDRNTDYDTVQRWLKDKLGRWFLLSRSYTRDTTLKELIEDERNILGLITIHDSTPIGLMGYLDYDKNQHKAEMRKIQLKII